MTAARVPGLLTVADLRFEPDDDGLRRELHDGVQRVRSAVPALTVFTGMTRSAELDHGE